MTTLRSAEALLLAGRPAEAAAACRTLLARDITDPGALRVLGEALIAQGWRAQGIAMLEAVPDPDVAVLVTLSNALREAGLAVDAEARARAALTQRPEHPPAHTDLTRARAAQRAATLGAGSLAASGLAPRPAGASAAPSRDAARAHLMTGNTHLAAGRLDDAALAYRDALAAYPDFAGALGNLGNVLTAQGRPRQALDSYRAALALEPDNADIGFAYSLALLLDGDFADGWRWHECRRRVAGLRWNYDRHPDLAQWRDGMDLTGRRILVLAEQGFGDMIQFVRLVPGLAERAARVVLELPQPLHRVFPGLPGVARLIDRDGPAPDCDIACPLLSLPRVLGLTPDTIPPPVATVRDDLRAHWGAWLGGADGTRRIGLVVSGESRHPHDARRSIPLARMAPILATPHRFVLVQTELRDADRETRDGLDGLRFPGAALTDFADTAALMANLDLIISVDSAAAHLAGSLGLPVWLLLAHAPDHRWMLDRTDSPWYPSMRLYRQDSPGGWDAVVTRIRNDLLAL